MKRLLICTSVLIAAATVLAAQQKPRQPSSHRGGIDRRQGHLHHVFVAARQRPRRPDFGPGGRISTDPHYPVWRAGANSATTSTTAADLDIAGLHVPAGIYTLFVDISDPDHWKLIVNKQTGEWGLKYDKSQDLGEVKMNMSKPPATVENLKYTLRTTAAARAR